MSHYTNRYNFWNDNKQTIALIDSKFSSYSEFENSYFKNETNFYVFFNLMRDRFNFGQDLKALYSIFACDFEWAKKTVFCGGGSSSTNNGNATSTIWKNFPCVTSKKDFKDGATFTYTSTLTDFGVVTLNPNGTFTSTGTRNKGVFSCTKTGRIFLDDAKTATPDSSSGSSVTNTNLTASDLTGGQSVGIGMKGKIVGDIQNLLIKLGYVNVSKDNKADSNFGRRTKKMVEDFQSLNGLVPPDGIVGKDTWAKLNDPAAVKNNSSSSDGSAKTSVAKDGETVAGSDVIIVNEKLKKTLRENLLKFN